MNKRGVCANDFGQEKPVDQPLELTGRRQLVSGTGPQPALQGSLADVRADRQG